MLNRYFRFFFVVLLLVFHACKRDNQDPKKPKPDDHADHGFITSVELTLLDTAAGALPQTFVFSDADGPGGLPPDRIDTIQIKSGTIYKGTITFWDKSDPLKPLDLTPQILAEKNSHLVCYEPFSNAAGFLAIAPMDYDGKYFLGLETIWEAKLPIISHVTITLKHQVGTKNGSCIPGSTDAEVVFPLVLVEK